MEFKINGLEYAWVGKELRHIASGNKFDEYFLDENLTIPLVFCEGVKIKSYWRKEPNVSDSIIRGFFGSSESVEHYNKKMELSKSLELKFDIYSITGHSSKVEYRIKSINKIVDLVFLDKNGDILIGIEVFCTNKKTHKDIKKFNEVKFPIYEYNIHTKEVYPISSGCTDTEKVKRQLEDIKELERNIFKIQSRVKQGNKIVQGIKKRIVLAGKEYYKIKTSGLYRTEESIDFEIRETKERRDSIEREISLFNEVEEEPLTSKIKGFAEKERQDVISLKRRIERFDDVERNEIESITDRINGFENQTGHISTVTKEISALNARHYEYTSVKNRNKDLREKINRITKHKQQINKI